LGRSDAKVREIGPIPPSSRRATYPHRRAPRSLRNISIDYEIEAPRTVLDAGSGSGDVTTTASAKTQS